MSKLPLPPSVSYLVEIGPALTTVRMGAGLWRIYFRAGEHPTAWGAFRMYGPVAKSRFDHHDSPACTQARGILYAARRGPTCIAEVFQETRTVERKRGEPWLVEFKLTRDLVLHDLRGTWCTRAGGSAAIHSGRRDHARLWSRAIYAAYPKIDGLAYCSSMDGNETAFALYERAQTAIPARPSFHRALQDPVVHSSLLNAAREFGYALV